mmetsp:Transcript_26304/g.87171  ORF Transcript_26304/g.87171 Transcript_26304/m.87171 type:complete len:344 (+) Transcript_26304:287-1318(+)
MGLQVIPILKMAGLLTLRSSSTVVLALCRREPASCPPPLAPAEGKRTAEIRSSPRSSGGSLRATSPSMGTQRRAWTPQPSNLRNSAKSSAAPAAPARACLRVASRACRKTSLRWHSLDSSTLSNLDVPSSLSSCVHHAARRPPRGAAPAARPREATAPRSVASDGGSRGGAAGGLGAAEEDAEAAAESRSIGRCRSSAPTPPASGGVSMRSLSKDPLWRSCVGESPNISRSRGRPTLPGCQKHAEAVVVPREGDTQAARPAICGSRGGGVSAARATAFAGQSCEGAAGVEVGFGLAALNRRSADQGSRKHDPRASARPMLDNNGSQRFPSASAAIAAQAARLR